MHLQSSQPARCDDTRYGLHDPVNKADVPHIARTDVNALIAVRSQCRSCAVLSVRRSLLSQRELESAVEYLQHFSAPEKTWTYRNTELSFCNSFLATASCSHLKQLPADGIISIALTDGQEHSVS